MAQQIFLKGGSFTGMRELGAFGRPLHMLYPQLVDCLKSDLGAEAALYLAEPVVDQRRSEADWYVNTDGVVAAFSSLEVEDRDRLRALVGHRIQEIARLADRLAVDPVPSRQQLAPLLRMAASLPLPENVFFIDANIPVVAFWGLETDNNYAPPSELQRLWLAPQDNATSGAQSPDGSIGAPPAGEDGVSTSPEQAIRHDVLHEVQHVVERVGFSQRFRLVGTAVFWGAAIASVLAFLLISGARIFGVLSIDDETHLDPQFASLIDATRREGELRQRIGSMTDTLLASRLTCSIPAPTPASADTPNQQEITDRLRDANAANGPISIALGWNNLNDLDLIVHCPSGEKVYFSNPHACGGNHDVDMNNSNNSERPIEHIVWPENTAKQGTYKVSVLYYKQKADKLETPFTVVLQQGGERKEFHGVAQAVKDAINVTEFEVR